MRIRKVLYGVLTGMVIALIAVNFIDLFDPIEYTNAVLNLVYKDDPDGYKKLVKTTDEDTENMYAQSLNSAMDTFSDMDLTGEMSEKYREIISDLMKNVHYYVKEAEKQKGGGYIVRLEIEPMTIFQDTIPLLQEQSKAYAVKLSNSVMSGAPLPSEKEIQNHIYEMYYLLLNKKIEAGIKYGKTEDIFLHIDKIKHRIYEIRPDDLNRLAYKLLSPQIYVI